MISDEETRKIAQLGRLHLSDEEVGRYAKDLSEILDYSKKLLEIDLEKVPAMSHVQSQFNIFREDEPQEQLTVEEALGNAPEERRSVL